MKVPSKIKVGFQKRSDTYTGMLGFVITNNGNAWQCEKSWNGWIDKKIPAQEYNNVPTSGFVLNKKVGGYKSDWNYRQSYIRVYDPRGFEFEISLGNLMLIMNYCSFEKGKAISGEFAYAWNGTTLWLLPVDSDEYKQAYAEFKREKQTFKPKDLKPGMILMKKSVRGSKREPFVYIGNLEVKDYQFSRYAIHCYRALRVERKKGHLFVSNDPDSYYKGFRFMKPTAFDELIGEKNIDEYLDKYKKQYEYEVKNLEFVPSEVPSGYFESIYYIDSKTILIDDYYYGLFSLKITDSGFTYEYFRSKDKIPEKYIKCNRVDLINTTNGYKIDTVYG